MIFLIWLACYFVVGFITALAVWLVCAYALKLFWAAMDRMGDGS